jgi:hypothetical protein
LNTPDDVLDQVDDPSPAVDMNDLRAGSAFASQHFCHYLS